ncbi:MAG: hypothetical protein ACK40X_09940, partial [Armatimonadota bacterium]
GAGVGELRRKPACVISERADPFVCCPGRMGRGGAGVGGAVGNEIAVEGVDAVAEPLVHKKVHSPKEVTEMRIAKHFVLLVYPFRHSLSGKEGSKRLERLNGRWFHWWRRLDERSLERALDDTYFFLPYIRSLLFPETALLPKGDASQQVGKAKELSTLPISQLAKEIHPDGVLRLTLAPELMETLRPLQLRMERKNERGEVVEHFEASLQLHWIDVALFPQNVGFLVLKVQMDKDKPDVRRLNDLLWYIRLVLPPTVGWQLADWQCQGVNGALLFKSRDLVDFLLQGLTDEAQRIDPTMEAFLERLSSGKSVNRYSASEMGQVYGQTFRLYTYACLDEDLGEQNPSSATQTVIASPFLSSFQRVLYELATCTDTNDPNYVPHPEGLTKLMQTSHIGLWENWEGMALHDNVVFLGKRPNNFLLNAFAHNVESDYFHLYLLTLYQKIRLSLLAGELLRHAKDLHRNLKEARALWDAFIMFVNHYWFAEVSFKPQGNELYRKFQRGLGALPLYESVGQEVRDLQEYYERKAERRISTLLNFLTFVGLPASLLIDLFSNALLKEASWLQFGLTTLVFYSVVGVAWVLWSRFGKE